MKKAWLLIALLALPLMLTACNTLQGAGDDLKEGGKALDRAIN